jgi:hypothetical protein
MLDSMMTDLYTDYIVSSFGAITATGLSSMTNNQISHDRVTRFLGSRELSSAELWKLTKPIFKANANLHDGVLIVDDTIVEKPYTKESDLITWHYDHCSGKNVKGVNLLSLLYSSSTFNLPTAYHVVRKDEEYEDIKTKKMKRKSQTTKNEVFRDMVTQALSNNIPFEYVIGDSWFGSVDNMRHISGHDKKFVFALKTNRLAKLKIGDKIMDCQAIGSLDLQEGSCYDAFLKGLEEIPVRLVKQVFKDGDSAHGVLYLVTNDLTLDFSSLTGLYQRRWRVEEYHKSLKSNLGLAKSPTSVSKTQENHIFLCLLAYVKLESISVGYKMNHFAMKTRIYLMALKTCYSELQKLKDETEVLPFAA